MTESRLKRHATDESHRGFRKVGLKKDRMLWAHYRLDAAMHNWPTEDYLGEISIPHQGDHREARHDHADDLHMLVLWGCWTALSANRVLHIQSSADVLQPVLRR